MLAVRSNLLKAADFWITLSYVTLRFSRHIANSPGFMTNFIGLASIILRRDWHQRKRRSKARFTLPNTGEAHLARAQNLYRGYLDYEALWPNWNSLGRPSPTTLGYSS